MAPDDIIELFSVFGPVSVRRVFSVVGVYADGTIFALIARGVIYLKTDAETVAAFERENLPPFTYTAKGGRRGVTSYRRMPDRLYDDAEELAVWARDALAAARRAGTRKPGTRKPDHARNKPQKKRDASSSAKAASAKSLQQRRKRKSRAT